MRVPGFLVRQLYVAHSLRNVDGGFQLQARNPLGDGVLVGIGAIAVDGVSIEPAVITATRDGEDREYRATEVSPAAPVTFRKGDVVTFHVAGLALEPGEHHLTVELVERDLGSLSLAITETLAAGW
jgi:hypothetical protein